MMLISDARTCKDGCKYLREWLQVLAWSGCSALRLRWVKLAPKWSVVFWIREKGDNGIMTKR